MFYLRSAGRWCGAALSSRPDTDFICRYAAALGVSENTMEIVESVTDPRSGELLKEPPTSPVPDPVLSTIVAILSKPDADITAGELKTLVLLALRRLRARWLLGG